MTTAAWPSSVAGAATGSRRHPCRRSASPTRPPVSGPSSAAALSPVATQISCKQYHYSMLSKVGNDAAIRMDKGIVSCSNSCLGGALLRTHGPRHYS